MAQRQHIFAVPSSRTNSLFWGDDISNRLFYLSGLCKWLQYVQHRLEDWGRALNSKELGLDTKGDTKAKNKQAAQKHTQYLQILTWIKKGEEAKTVPETIILVQQSKTAKSWAVWHWSYNTGCDYPIEDVIIQLGKNLFCNNAEEKGGLN